MTEDPIKLFVIVMTILLCVLGFVAFHTYQQASAYQQAVADAPKHAKQLRESTGRVKLLCEQLKQSKFAQGPQSLISRAAKYHGIDRPPMAEEPRPKKISRTGRERRIKVELRRGNAMTRAKLARFCQTVENDSRQILKTIEISVRRHTGDGAPKPGDPGEISTDLYVGTIIFGYRFVE